jgi:hypothetical protein
MPKIGDPSKKPGDSSAEDASKGSPQSPLEQRALSIPRSGHDMGGGSGTAWPVLTQTNYNSWSLLMRVI